MESEEFYTTLEVAKILKISKTTVRRKIKNGDISPVVKLGKRVVRIPKYVIHNLAETGDRKDLKDRLTDARKEIKAVVTIPGQKVGCNTE